MTKLEEVRQIVAKAFENAEKKESIETLAQINTCLDAVGEETKELEKSRDEIVKSYKDLIKHTSFKADASAAANEITPQKVEFESFLKSFIEKEKEKNNG